MAGTVRLELAIFGALRSPVHQTMRIDGRNHSTPDPILTSLDFKEIVAVRMPSSPAYMTQGCIPFAEKADRCGFNR